MWIYNATVKIINIIGIVLLFSACVLTPRPAFNSDYEADDSESSIRLVEVQKELDATSKQKLDSKPDFQMAANAKIIATGDIMLGTRFPDKSYLPEISSSKLFGSKVQDLLQRGDVTFGNLEGAICGSGGNPKQKKYIFAMPDDTAKILSLVGYNLISVANNHAGDMGSEGCKSTIQNLNASGINFAGYLDYPICEFCKNDIKYALVAVSPNYGVVSLHDSRVLNLIQELSTRNDIVIVSMHIGAEGAKHQNVTRKNEKYLGEDRGNPYKFARDVIEAGADVVLGHGPHVTRAIDLYKGRFIAYSLGNFCTVSRVNLSDVNGIAPILELDLAPDGEFVLGKIHSTKQYARRGVRMDDEKQVLQKIIELTNKDFPESSLTISDDGFISVR